MDRWVRETFPQQVWCNFDIVNFKCFLKIRFFEKIFESLLFFSRFRYIKNFTKTDTMTKKIATDDKFVKFLPLLEACFDLISWPCFYENSDLGRENYWNQGFESSLRKVNFFIFFLFVFKFSIKNCISLFLTFFGIY